MLYSALLQSCTHVLDMEYSMQVDEQICLLFTLHPTVYTLIIFIGRWCEGGGLPTENMSVGGGTEGEQRKGDGFADKAAGSSVRGGVH